MAETKLKDEARIYTTHGDRKNQGKLARINGHVALAYTKGNGPNEEIVGYTTLEELMIKAATCTLPQYQLEL